jgi:hypothetical protein
MSRWFRLRFLVPAMLFALLVPLCVVLAQRASPPPDGLGSGRGGDVAPNLTAADAGKPLQVTITGPFTHDNLSIFLLHGPDQVALKKYVMLAEAIEKKLFVIHETQSVNELSMENLSPDTEVILLSGDILKGGQQDRIAQFDLIVPPKSGKIPLPAYCVERTAARWMSPIDASNGTFKASPGQVVSSSCRLAGRYYKDQGGVWQSVIESQEKLSKNVMKDARAKESDSSLALSLKIKEVTDAGDKYVKTLQPALGEAKDVVGYAYAINGKVYAADVFGSSELFRKVWPRLIEANAIEAVSDLEKDKKFEPVTVAKVEAFLRAADAAKAQSRDLDDGKKLREVISNDEKERVLRFETKEAGEKGSFLRRNYLKY